MEGLMGRAFLPENESNKEEKGRVIQKSMSLKYEPSSEPRLESNEEEGGRRREAHMNRKPRLEMKAQ
jgi:hypothetical protein